LIRGVSCSFGSRTWPRRVVAISECPPGGTVGRPPLQLQPPATLTARTGSSRRGKSIDFGRVRSDGASALAPREQEQVLQIAPASVAEVATIPSLGKVPARNPPGGNREAAGMTA